MTLEEFSQIHHLSREWVDLRSECNRIVGQPDYWYRRDLQESARELAVKASEILAASNRGNQP